MKLKALNKKIADYGFPLEIESTDEDFHGHCKGIIIGLTKGTGEDMQIVESYTPNKDDLGAMLKDQDIYKLAEVQVQRTDENTVEQVMAHFVPYYVENHSFTYPSLNAEVPILGEELPEGKCNYVDAELLFVHNGMNRYSTICIVIRTVPFFKAIYNSFLSKQADYFLELLGANKREDGKYVMDFYTSIGERKDVVFESPKDLQAALVSLRIIDLHVEEEDHTLEDSEEKDANNNTATEQTTEHKE